MTRYTETILLLLISIVIYDTAGSRDTTHTHILEIVGTLLGECFETAFSFRGKNHQSMPTVGRDIITLPRLARRSRTTLVRPRSCVQCVLLKWLYICALLHTRG